MKERLIIHEKAIVENVRRIERGKMDKLIFVKTEPRQDEGQEGEMRVYKNRLYLKHNGKWQNLIYSPPVYDYDRANTAGSENDMVIIKKEE